MLDGDLDDTIRSLKARVAQRDRLIKRLEGAQRQLETANAGLAEAERELENEESDVARLEGLSLRSLFYTVLSSKQEQLEQERQDVLRAELARDERRDAVQRLAAEIDSLEAELKTIDDPASDLARALTAKEEQIRRSPSAAQRELLEIDGSLAALEAEAAEIEEARSAGQRAAASLADVVESLDSAGSWGTWDMLGGGLISTAIKHSHIDKAKARAQEAQADLRAFERELADVATHASYEIELDGFSKFADYFLDGLIFDWVVQSKIQKSQQAARDVAAQVDEALAKLAQRAGEAEGELEALIAKRQAVIER